MIRIRFTHGVSGAPMADPNAPDGIVWKPARHSIGLIDPEREPGDSLDLVTEFLTGASMTPWASAEDRKTALRFLPNASWIAPGFRERLVDHVRMMPWFEDREETPARRKPRKRADKVNVDIQFVSGHGCMLYDLPDSEARSGHVWLPARWSPGNWDEVPGGILDEMRRGAGAMPWLSDQHRQDTLDRLRGDGWGYLNHGREILDRLIRHVETTPCWLERNDPYLQSRHGIDALD